jgi:hypothetical protein
MRPRALIVGIAVLACPGALAQEGPKPARATIEDLSWLAGNWVMTAGGTIVEERWTPPAGGAMLAVLRTSAAIDWRPSSSSGSSRATPGSSTLRSRTAGRRPSSS